MNFKILILLLFFPFLAISNELDISKLTNEEIIQERKGAMSKIKVLSTAIYPLVFAGEFDEIKDLNNKLLINAEQFKLLFPEGSQGGKAADLIWTDRETFNLYNDNFIQDIENIMQSIEEEDSVSLSENFNKMAANCGTCHRKFRN